MKQNIVLNLFSSNAHVAQIATGFLMLEEQGKINLTLNEKYDSGYQYSNISLAEAYINGKRVIFDTEDGYWEYEPGGMEYYLQRCDYYFKRSFSQVYNQQYSSELQSKIHPLGFNYYVTYSNNPIKYTDKYIVKNYKHYIKRLAGLKMDSYFTPEVFEAPPNKIEGEAKILFFVGLYEPNLGVEEKDKERVYINETRVNLVKKLQKEYGKFFTGGVQATEYAARYCPELILPKRITERGHYQKLIKNSDICIGTMGLHESIGWKTAQFVASSRGIVNEKFHYKVPGDFSDGKNYLAFDSIEQCIENVQRLFEDRELLYHMKEENYRYYQEYLRPDKLVERAINIVVKS